MNTQPWEEISHETAYHKYSQTIERRDFRLPNGQVSDYYVRIEKPGVCVLALTEDNKIVTIPQFRPGPKLVLRELPGGQLDLNEDMRTAAMRELLEETGYTGEVQEWMGHWHCDAYTQANRNIIVAKNCHKVAEPKLEGDEFGEVELVEVAAFVRQAREGALTDAAGALLALDYLQLLR